MSLWLRGVADAVLSAAAEVRGRSLRRLDFLGALAVEATLPAMEARRVSESDMPEATLRRRSRVVGGGDRRILSSSWMERRRPVRPWVPGAAPSVISLSTLPAREVLRTRAMNSSSVTSSDSGGCVVMVARGMKRFQSRQVSVFWSEGQVD